MGGLYFDLLGGVVLICVSSTSFIGSLIHKLMPVMGLLQHGEIEVGWTGL